MEVFAIFGVLILFALIWCLISYLIKALTLFALAKKAGAIRPWFAFIPFLQNMKLYNLAGFSEKTFLTVWLLSLILGCVPVKEVLFVGTILSAVAAVYVKIRVAQNFGGEIWLILLNILFEPFVLIYLALSRRQFVLTPEWEPLAKLIHDLNLDTDFGVEPIAKEQTKKDPIDVEID